ncbi:amidohydrolase family protein [Actinosynnema sp. NPDC047251]|uniref:D-glutamate deacylase n=1 Tax=Saccharothrix espanaensis (strain ATCC 51144 / DSM 44229 / JCM 9112 / NBRC 15066 / NRRL 15764) TaxID=1179773 RepID=K0JZN9_SACES|nr:amidohydrolase family protein [Saccharothrix espanaensis]CCH30094.1 D-glutamate deacylase [Saccharothrix espanaensis DSM 44229]
MVLLRGGRVLDPGTGVDRVADVLVRDGKVAAVGPSLPAPGGVPVVDVTGLVVGPGFVDLHSHVHSIAGHRLQGLDGVTTALDLEAGLTPIGRAYARAAWEGRPLNYGFSASWGAARAQVLMGLEPDADFRSGLHLLGDPRWQRSSSPAELAAWVAVLEREIGAGALGVGVLLGYAPDTDPAEYLAVAAMAARANAPIYTHVRELVESNPDTPVDGSFEVVRAAVETGASMHHCHVNSTSRRHVDRVLGLLEKTRAEGSRVTVEAYPYGAGSTGIGAFFLAPERLAAWDITPGDIMMVETGERVADVGRLRQLRETDPGALCVVSFVDEENPADAAMLHRALAFPDSIVASDAMPVLWPDGTHERREWPLPPKGRTHPRTAGTFAKSLRLMVRETGTWSWLEAFRRCSWLPARVLDPIAPGAVAKGHLGVGADADIVVLDPERITDTATYLDPVRPSVGVRHLLVAGTFVVRDGDVQVDALPGRPLRGEPA